MTRLRLSARDREKVLTGAGSRCDICGSQIIPGQLWQVSHRIPLAAGGDDVPSNRFPVHAKCHAVQTATIDAPLIAKVRRIRQKHIGAKDRSANPIPGGRHHPLKRKLDGTTVNRATGERV